MSTSRGESQADRRRTRNRVNTAQHRRFRQQQQQVEDNSDNGDNEQQQQVDIDKDQEDIEQKTDPIEQESSNDAALLAAIIDGADTGHYRYAFRVARRAATAAAAKTASSTGGGGRVASTHGVDSPAAGTIWKNWLDVTTSSHVAELATALEST